MVTDTNLQGRGQINSRTRSLRAIRGEVVDRVPVFPLIMHAAQKRHGITYRQFASDGGALAEAQLRFHDTFAVDAITVCSDAFRITGDLGGTIVFPEQSPPYASAPVVRNAADVEHLRRPDPRRPGSRMADRIAAVEQLVRTVGSTCLACGWVDMPFAEACSVCGVSMFMVLIHDDPPLAHRLLDFLTEIVKDFALAQVSVGTPMIGAGDSAASLISGSDYRAFALPYEQRVCAAVHEAGGMVKLHICGNTQHLLHDIAGSGADLMNVDHMVDLSAARDAYVSVGAAIKGNLDPVADLLQATPERCRERSLECMKITGGSRYLLSPGCEVPADTPDEVLRAFCSAPELFAPVA
jgi:MtaA/CmuA family methyltransferase